MKTKRKQDENLVPNSERTPKKRQEIARKAGIASGKARREKKACREWLEAALESVIKDKEGTAVKSPDNPRRSLTRKEAGMIKLAVKFANGDLKAIEQAVKILGESETKLVVETVSPAEKLAELISEARKK